MWNGKNLTTKQRLVLRNGFVAISCSTFFIATIFGIAAMRKTQAENTMPLTPTPNQTNAPTPGPTPGPTTSDVLWQDVNPQSLPSIEAVTPPVIPSARTLRLNQLLLAQTIAKAPLESQGKANETTHETILPLPLPDGSFAQFRLENSPVLPSALASQFPEIQSFRGQGIGIAATMRCDWTPRGFHATIFLGDQLINIHPISLGDTQHYASYYNHAQRNEAEQFFCEVKDELPKNESSLPGDTAALNYGGTRRTYRIAIATTVEYTNAPSLGGGSVASTIASLNTFLNAVNTVYERELTIRFVLAAGNDNAVYTAEPDPFTNGDASQMLSAVTAALKDKVGVANYDLGHVLGTGGGGVASLGVACGGDSKSRGVSLILTGEPVGTGFSLQTLMHEIGHQFGATHTFSASCSGNRTDQTAYESASGLTIMSYGGTVCTPIIVGSAAPHFHSASIQQIQEFVASDTTCAQRLPVSNTAPTLNPGIAFTIPKQTPFVLTATGADADAGDFQNFTYSWEQVDAGATPPFIGATGPLFRPFAPSSNPVRIFPSLTYILNNANVPPATIGSLETAENLPDVARTMNFNGIVRDNRGGVAIEPVAITVSNSGPFEVTQPNTAVTWTGGSTQTVSWNVNGTNAAPVNCQTVRITLSADGGNTFPYVLNNNAVNNGSANVTIPLGLFSTKARIKVEAIGNIFFDISNANFNLMPGDGCPIVSEITPLIGTSGTSITITGTGFTGVTGVTFAGGAVASFVVNSDTQITVTAPSNAVSGFITLNKGGCGVRQTPYFTVATGPAFTRGIDDNSTESFLSFGGTNPVLWVNRIEPQQYPATVSGITFFVSPFIPIGTNLTMLVGVNPSGGSNINGMTFQTVDYTTVSNNQFVTVFVPNVTIPSGDAVVGFAHVPQSGVFPVGVDTTPPLQNRSYISSNAGANFSLSSQYNFVIRAVFSPGAVCSSNCTPPSGNTPPNAIPGAVLTRPQGTLFSATQIATISDAQTNAGALTITPTVIPDGVTITNLTNTNGVVTAQIQAACSATTGLKVATFAINDGELNTTMNVLVNVPANVPPTLGTYTNLSIGAGTSTVINPSAAPKDNGSITSLTVSSPTFTGSLSINAVTGNITVNNAGSGGTHTVTVTATDNCGAVSTTSFQLTVETSLTITSLSPSAIQAKSAGFNLVVNGTGIATTSIVRWNGANRPTTFNSATQLTAAIPASDINLNAAGSANITVFDPATNLTSNTVVFTINAPNPAPTLLTLSPTTATAGGTAFTLTVTGTNFINTSQVHFNGNARPTTFVSATQLTAAITATDIANTGTAAITVVNPSPGGGTSNSVNLSINNPTPGALTLNPASILVGSSPPTITVTGTNFRANSVARVNGANRTTTFVSATQLTMQLAAGDVASTGTLKITVNTPPPGGGVSPEADFVVNNPALILTSLNPATVTKGGAAFTLTVNGTGFLNGSVVRWNGSARATTFVSATQLTAAIPDTDIVNEGNVNITVINPAPGESTSNPLSFSIVPTGYESDVAPRPNGSGNGTVTSADWTQLGRFVAALDIAANGTEFQRADVAPKDSKGDGRITIADWVQGGRYAAGLDPVVGIGGPTQPIASITSMHNLDAGTRSVRVVNNAWVRGQVNTLQIELESQGNENAFGFSLEFDPKLLRFYRASASNGATLTVNSQFITQGRIGLIIALPAGQQFAVGTRSVLQLQFIPNGGADHLTTAIRFSDSVIKCDFADPLANTLTGTTFTNANISIAGQSTAHVSATSYAMNDAAVDSILSAFGIDLATTTAAATSLPLPSVLGGTRVVVRDSVGTEHVAPLFFVSPTQINYLIPTDTADGLATVTISNSRGTISRGIVNVNRISPGLFTADATGKGFAAATLQRNRRDGSTSFESVTRFDQSRGQIVAVPIEFNAGDELSLAVYGTGLRYRNNLNSVKARIGGVETEVLYAGAQGHYIGLDQINLRIPPATRGRGEVVIEIEIDGNLTNPVKIFIQ